MRYLITCILLITFTSKTYTQNVAISNSANLPHESAMLDIQSTDKGILIPRMTSVQRENINAPANGLLVFDLNSQGFWFYNASEWIELAGVQTLLSDADNDTDIQVESTPDEDAIRMNIEGDEGFVLQQNANGVHRFSTYEYSRNLFFGHQAGINSSAGFNTFLGYETGYSNLGGAQNVFIGYQAGMDNMEGDGNLFLGYRAGQRNLGSFNVFMGRHSGLQSENGDGNVFIGYNSGDSNFSGSNNVFLGYNSAISNVDGEGNTFVGQGSGFYNSSGSNNTFIGQGSGRRNRTGERNVALGNNALGTTSTSGDHGDGNTALGFEAGYSLNNSSSNTYIGENAGHFNIEGDGNTLVGSESGYFMTNASFNTALGYNALRHTNGGQNNIAIGDSSMLITTGNYKISIGDKAGLSAEGSHNIFIGRDSGAENDGASQNVFMGDLSGTNNSDGQQNTFLGAETGRLNTTGNGNSFLGFHSGDRNSTGNENTFIGTLSGHGNTTGEQNVSLGHHSLYSNSLGSGNVAIGHEALSNIDELNNNISRTENTAIGYQAGYLDLGNYNITLGSKSKSGHSQYNIALGHEASTDGGLTAPDATYGIAIGYQTLVGSQESIAIGKSTTATNGNIILGNDGSSSVTIDNSVGIGNDVFLAQQNTIILGDEANENVATGVGTNTPNAKFEIKNTSFWSRIFSVKQDNDVVFEIKNNYGVSIGSGDIAPINGLSVLGNTELNADLDVATNVKIGNKLYINTTVMPTDYQVAIDGKVACTEIRVQAVEDWPDYVFEEDYPLMSLKDLRKYIATNNHLPGVPAAEEVNESGFEIGKTQEILLEKIEELSLYILQLEERLSKVETKK